MRRGFSIACLWLLTAVSGFSQALLDANAPGNTYEQITAVFAPGNDTTAVEDPQCIHPTFGRHIVELWDSELGQNVFEFYSHVTPDNDRCINFDRQRVEIKTYDASPDNLKGVVGESITYKWKFRIPVGFKPSPNFTHIHQIKAVGGTDDDPIFTLTVRKSSPNKLELIHNNTDKVAIVNLSWFEGVWVECKEVVYVHPTDGTYSLTIKKISDGTTLLSYSNSSLLTIRADNDFVRPKWGIYRSLLSSSDLRDESLRFAGFYIGEATATTLPSSPSSLSASSATSNQIVLSWTDNSSNEESFRIERSTDGSNWAFLANVPANSTGYVNTGLGPLSKYYYRVRAENMFGNSGYSNTSSATTTLTGIITVGSGNWSSTVPGAPWPGGVLPSSTDNVLIADTCVITLDQDATVANLIVGQGNSGTLQTSKSVVTNLTINGDLSINAGGSFKTQSATTTFSGPHTLTITGNLTHNGTVFDLRTGTAGTTLGVINITFGGSTNSIVTINGTYSSTNGDFNAITINKTGSAKVVLGSDIYVSGGSTSGLASMNSVITFVNGIVETGNYTFISQSTTGASVTGASNASYVLGAMGRGLSSSGGSSKDFPVGDSAGYRPFTLRSTTAGGSTGHYATVRVIHANANTGSSSLVGGIDRVSAIRYFQIGYNKGTTSTASMNFDRFYPTYGLDDGIRTGNTNLRVAYSTDLRNTWTRLNQNTNPHTTAPSTTPTQIKPDSLNPAIALTSNGASLFIALADTLGMNSLDNPLLVSARVLLQGPFNAGSLLMDNPLRTSGVLVRHFGSNIKSTAVDSITLEIRNAPTAAGSSVRALQPAWILTDGSVTSFTDSTNGSVSFSGVPPGAYYLVARHRNHLAIMTATTQAMNAATPLAYDFTTAPSQAYGSNPMVEVASGVFAMIAGDGNQSGIVTSADANGAFGTLNSTGYNLNDINLSGIVTAADANSVFRNMNASSQINEP